MLLVLDDEHKSHIAYGTSVAPEVLQEFCKMALEFIHRKINPKVYQVAAKKLQVEQNVVEEAIKGIVYLLTESSKLMLSDVDLQDSLLSLGYNEALTEVILNVYKENRQEIRTILFSMSLQLPHYHNLEWRMDVQRKNSLDSINSRNFIRRQVASRTLKHQVEPIITLKLHTSHHNQRETRLLQTDPINLVHLTRELEQALTEARSQHTRRIERNIK